MAVIGPDDRILVVDPTTSHWKSVGRWDITTPDGPGFGSGVLLGHSFVLTALHNLDYIDKNSTFSPAYSSIGGNTSTPFGSVGRKFDGGWNIDANGDIALIETTGPTSVPTKDIPGMVVFLDLNDSVGKSFSHAGYPGDLNSGNRMYSASGTVSEVKTHGVVEFSATMDFMPGQSGGPVFFEQDGKTYTAGVLHSWESEEQPETLGTLITKEKYDAYNSLLKNTEQSIDAKNLPENLVIGSSKADSFSGGHRQERIFGNAGDDALNGNGGADQIYGGDGNDQLAGSSYWQVADDLISDRLEGGAGDDFYYVDYSKDYNRRMSIDDDISGEFNGDVFNYIDILKDSSGSDTINFRTQFPVANFALTGDYFQSLGAGSYGQPNDSIYRQIRWNHDESFGYWMCAIVVSFTDPIDGKTYQTALFYEDWFGFGPSLIMGGRAITAIVGFQNGQFGITLEGWAAGGSPNSPTHTGTSGADSISATNSADVIYGLAGNDAIAGLDGNDVIIGGLGDDLLEGGDGADVYLYETGDGSDTINDEGNTTDIDVLRIEGYTPEQISIERGSSTIWDAELHLGSSGDVITLVGHFGDNLQFIEQIVFEDGLIWTEKDLRELYLAQHSTAGDDVIDGFFVDDVINGGDGHDSIYAYDGDDIIIGGKGDDFLEGLQGNDTYIFDLGDGEDWIQEWGDPGSEVDKIVFGSGITTNDVTVDRAYDGFFDLMLTIGQGGDSIRVLGQFYDDWETIEQFVFDDTTVWTAQDIKEIYLTAQATSGDDDIHGFFGADVISGGAGEDGLYGYEGDDRLIGGAGDDFLVGDEGNDEFVFVTGDGFDWIADFAAGEGTDDLIEVDVVGFDDLSDILAAASEWAGNTFIDFGGGDGLALEGVTLASLHADDFRFV